MAIEPELSIVLPAYREAENLAEILPRLQAVLPGLGFPCEIMVVDTMAPTDDTPAVCAAGGARYVNRRNSDLYGDAVRTAIAEARGRYVLFMDADGSHPPEFVAKMAAERENCDVVAASRYVDGGGTDNPRVLILMSRVLNLIYSVVLNIKCADISNSFKLYRRERLASLRLYCRNFDVIEEILFKMVKARPDTRIKEIPFTFERRKFGVTKRNLPAFMLSFAVTLVKLRFDIR
ncbi:MAG: glycosyltransferase [Elusimicrobia bacterium]|nr:glycosyltransferase [Elusimicrobiota bacterium]